MSVHISAAVYKAKMGSATRKLVALKLADIANDDGSSIWMSTARIADQVEVHKRTVQRILDAFVEEGLLIIEKLGGNGPRSTTHYSFDMEKVLALPRTSDIKGDTKSPLTKTSRATSTTAMLRALENALHGWEKISECRYERGSWALARSGRWSAIGPVANLTNQSRGYLRNSGLSIRRFTSAELAARAVGIELERLAKAVRLRT